MEQLEDQLRQQAQILGDLNMELNKFMEKNQQISSQIVHLETRITKKKKLIDQETKDKNIIHQKLVAAEREKQALELDMDDEPEAMKEMVEKKIPPQPVQQQIKRPDSLNKISRKEQKKEVNKEQQGEKYKNSEKGGYEPPLLFGDDKQKSESEDSQEEEGDGEVLLSSIQEKLASLKHVDDNEDDD